MSDRATLIKRIGTWVAVVAALIAIPGVIHALDNFGKSVGRHPLSSALGAVALLCLVIVYFDELLALLHIQTSSSIHRRLQRWLYSYKYALIPGDPMVVNGVAQSRFQFAVKGPFDLGTFTFRDRIQPPSGIEIFATVGLSPDQMAIFAKADPTVVSKLVLDVVKQIGPTPGMSYNVRSPLDSNGPFCQAQFVIESRDVNRRTVISAMHALRMYSSTVRLIVSDAVQVESTKSAGSGASGSSAGSAANAINSEKQFGVSNPDEQEGG